LRPVAVIIDDAPLKGRVLSVGSYGRATLVELCGKYDIPVPVDTRGQVFDGFGPFAAAYIAGCACLRAPSDLYRLVLEVAQDAKASGALWIEPALSMSFYMERFGGLGPTLELLCAAAASAELSTGVGIGFIVAAERQCDPKEAEMLARGLQEALSVPGAAMISGRQGVVGFGLHGAEAGNPPGAFGAAFKVLLTPTPTTL